MPVIKYKDPDTSTWIEVGSAASTTRNVSTISSSQTLGSAAKTDYVYLCSAGLTATMPTAVGNTNRYTVKRTGGSNVTIDTTASQTIDGSSTYTISVANQAIDLVSDGSNWRII